MPNLMLACRRFLKAELLRSEKTSKILQRNLSKKIEIPPRIHRGPLDVLQALSGTVDCEAGVPEYRIQHGGYFNTTSGHFKRLICLSMESGRKAAKWVVQENPNLFTHKYAEPYIEAFAPPKKITENTEISEDTLLDSIGNVNVEDSITLYKKLKEKNIDVSNETKQLLLEMVCYFNGINKPDNTLIDSMHFKNPKKSILNTWKKDGFAEELFLEMEPTLEAYTALILGRARHKDINSALKLYEEGKNRGLQFGLEIYNFLLENVCNTMFDHALQEARILELLNEMKGRQITPNVDTLNSTLSSIVFMSKRIQGRSFALKVYQEFISIGIQPSLATYYYLLKILYAKNEVSPLFNEILSEVSEKTFFPQHPDDFEFFVKAMGVAAYTFKSIDLSKMVHNILMTGNNRNFLVGNIPESTYYQMYLITMARYGKIKDAIDLLEKIVPQLYLPEPSGILVLLSALKKRDETQCLPRIFPLIEEVSINSNKICSLLLSIIVHGLQLNKEDGLFTIANKILNATINNYEFISNASNMSDFLKIFIFAGDKTSADMIFTKAISLGMENVPLDFESLERYNDLCISTNDKKNALLAVEFAVVAKHAQADTLMEKVTSKFELSKNEKIFLDKLMKIHEKTKKFEETVESEEFAA